MNLQTALGSGPWYRDAGDLGSAAGHISLAQGEGVINFLLSLPNDNHDIPGPNRAELCRCH